ncbi:MAG: hypothetical protein V1799_06185 [bacterium]
MPRTIVDFHNLFLTVLIIVSLSLGTENTLAQNSSGEKFDLKILYLGTENSARQQEFIDTLSSYFTNVKGSNVAFIGKAPIDSFDVIIIDVVDAEQSIEFPMKLEDITKPALLIGWECGQLLFKAYQGSGYM